MRINEIMLNRSNILVFVCGILIGVVLTIAATLVILRIKSITEKKI